MVKTISTIVFLTFAVVSFSGGNQALAGETDAFAEILKKVDALNCTEPEKIADFYHKKLVILSDDKRALLENRIKRTNK